MNTESETSGVEGVFNNSPSPEELSDDPTLSAPVAVQLCQGVSLCSYVKHPLSLNVAWGSKHLSGFTLDNCGTMHTIFCRERSFLLCSGGACTTNPSCSEIVKLPQFHKFVNACNRNVDKVSWHGVHQLELSLTYVYVFPCMCV
jgi:hypothetical protein